MASRRNSLIEQRLKKRQDEEYKKRLKNVKGKLDLTPPRQSVNSRLQQSKVYKEQERQAAIDKENTVIFEKLEEIKTSPGMTDHMNKNWKPSIDRMKGFRERKQRKIDKENKYLEERLKKVQSYYDVDEWEKDYQKHLYYLTMMENTTKDSDSVQYEAAPESDKKDKKSNDEEDNSLLHRNENQGNSDKQDEENSEKDDVLDAEELRAAIEDENKDKIFEILGRTSEKEELHKLCDKYQEIYEKDLMEDVKSSLDEEAHSVVQTLFSSAAEEDARRLNEAIKGLGTDENTIVEILCTRNNKELEAIREEYNKQFGRSLEEDIKGDTSVDLEKILVELSKGQREENEEVDEQLAKRDAEELIKELEAIREEHDNKQSGGSLLEEEIKGDTSGEKILIELSKGQREESEEVDEQLAKRDAEELIEAGIRSWGTEEGVFIRIFTQRSLPQLAAMYPEYNKLAEMDIEESIEQEMDGDLQKTFLALVRHSRNPSGVQDDKLNKAIKDGDTETVARIILPMNKAQLAKLCSSYKKTNETELAGDIDKKCNGDLKQMLQAKLGKKNKEKEKENAQSTNKEENEKKEEKKPDTVKEQDVLLDVEELHQAIQDNDEDKIINILSKNCSDHEKLLKLQDKYREEHKQGLLDAIESVLTDEDLQDSLDSMFLSAPEYNAKSLYEATKGIGTDEDLLIEIFCTRSSSELAAIQDAYEKRYGTSLESDITSDTSGDFEDFLLELLKGSRDESDKVDKAQAKKDAEALFQAGVKKPGTNEKAFINILTKSNPAQLNMTITEYKKLAKVDIEESIEKEMSGDLEKGLLSLVKYMRNPIQMYSKKLRSWIQDGDISTAACFILTSDKAKLNEVMNEYKRANNVTLEDDVQKNCSEDVKRILLAKMSNERESEQQKGKKGRGKGKGKSFSKDTTAEKQYRI